MKKYLYLVLFLFTALFASDSQQSFWETYTAALRGDSESQFLVGTIYERGVIVEQDMRKAAFWYEKAAQQGLIDAEFNIGIMYAAGRGVKEDETKAILWLKRAADQGDEEAHKLLLGILDKKLKNSDSPIAILNTADTPDLINCAEIPPVTLYTKEDSRVCAKKNECKVYKRKTVLTSTKKCGEFYKISGTVSKNGWKEFNEEGWINEKSIDHQR